jgi:hypothetical protein
VEKKETRMKKEPLLGAQAGARQAIGCSHSIKLIVCSLVIAAIGLLLRVFFFCAILMLAFCVFFLLQEVSRVCRSNLFNTAPSTICILRRESPLLISTEPCLQIKIKSKPKPNVFVVGRAEYFRLLRFSL